MSICPRPDAIAKTEIATPGTFTANPPAQRDESCGVATTTTTITGGTSTTTTVYVQGPAGPQGPVGPASCSLGMKWEGPWATATAYKKQTCPANPNASVVQKDGRTWICLDDHTSDETNMPVQFNGGFYWELIAGSDGTQSNLLPEELSFFDSLKDGVFDWMKNADLGDWLLAGAVAAGVIYAGSEIISMYTDDGEGDGNADARYNGSNGYAGAYAAPSLPTVISSLCTYAGIIHDVTALPADECEFSIASNTNVRSILEQLSLAYQFDMIDSGGILKFVPRNVTAITTITLEDMGFSTDAIPPAPYTAKRFQGIDLPKNVSLSYYSYDADYNTFTQSSELFTYTAGQNVNLQVPVNLTHAKAKAITELSLVNSHLERMNYKFKTSYKFIEVEPGDIVNTPMGLTRILKVNEINEGILEFEACDAGDAASIVASALAIQVPAVSNNTPVSISYSQALWIDPPNLDDQDKNVRIYAAVHGYGKAGWPGAAIYMSEDGGTSYEQVGIVQDEATIGLVETATVNTDYHGFDNTTTITVKLKTGTLLSKTEAAVLNDANRCMIGQEIICFKTATLTAPMTYQLSGLLRGRQGTEQFCATHVANELFVLLDDAILKLPMTDADRGTIKKFKAVTLGSSLDVVVGDNVQIISNNTRAWPVYNGRALISGQDWIISFKERVRFDNALKDYAEINHDYDWAGWGIAILGPGDVVKSTHVVQVPEFTYTAAMQVADFGIIQSSVKISVVQMSQKWGGGYPLVINS